MLKGLATVLMLIVSNVLMTLAWYGNLKFDFGKVFPKWGIFGIIIVSWGIALLEYFFMIPANRIGFQGNGGPFSLMQLKVIQETITLIVFATMSILIFKGDPLRWNHFAAFICLVMAVYFVFKG
ncbi:MAG: DMT family protein [Bacteroidales bacterium]|nr:DMT family protein [Bacteroidales bacterium]